MEDIKKSARIAAEVFIRGLHWTFAPMLDIGRDPRWGRISEAAGEDVYLMNKIADAYVKGFQDKIFQGIIRFWLVQNILLAMELLKLVETIIQLIWGKMN